MGARFSSVAVSAVAIASKFLSSHFCNSFFNRLYFEGDFLLLLYCFGGLFTFRHEQLVVVSNEQVGFAIII